MKKTILTLMAGAVLFLTACQQKQDPQLLADVSSFETNWSSFTNDVTSFEESLKAETEKIKAAHSNEEMNTNIMNVSAKMKDAEKMKMDSLMSECMAIEKTCENMMNEAQNLNSTIAEMTTNFTAWKEKLDKFEINAETAKSDLAGMQAKMTEMSGNLTNWKEMWNKESSTHSSTQDALMTMVNNAMPAKK